jgi:hypothetical protein
MAAGTCAVVTLTRPSLRLLYSDSSERARYRHGGLPRGAKGIVLKIASCIRLPIILGLEPRSAAGGRSYAPNSKALLLNLNLIVTRLEKAVAFGAETIEFGFHRHERVAGGFLKHRGLP